jgi:hypothetical protein
MRRSALTLLVGGVLALTAVAAGASVPVKTHSVPKDACALLTPEQVATLVASATAKPTQVTKATAGCAWSDEEATTLDALDSLNVQISKLPVSAAELKFSLAAEAKDPDHHVVKHLGDFAAQSNVIPANSEVKVLLGNLLVDVEFSGGQPVTDAENRAVLALARAVSKKV